MSLEHAISRQIIHNPSRFTTTWQEIVSGPYKLTPAEFNFVQAGIVREIIGTHNEVTVPGWKSGPVGSHGKIVWTGKPWQILYNKTARLSARQAAFMFGLMCQYAFIHDEQHWYTDKTVYEGHDVERTYYFQKGALGR